MAAFEWLKQQIDIHGEVLPRKLLQQGFILEGKRIPLVSPQGIFRPAVLPEIPLSIATSPNGPYIDGFSKDGFLHYRYRGTNPLHRDNVALRLALKHKAPLIYLHGIAPGKYLASWPVYIVGDDPRNLTFTVLVDDAAALTAFAAKDVTEIYSNHDALAARRMYVTRMTKVRIHQQAFRVRVLNAYREQCACCRLKHQELLDAAHIIPDSEPEGEPKVTNGIALCKLHHAAYDKFFIGISPDYNIIVRDDILQESDGPMLLHGLKGLHNSKIVIPRSTYQHPDRDLLEMQYQRFKKTA